MTTRARWSLPPISEGPSARPATKPPSLKRNRSHAGPTLGVFTLVTSMAANGVGREEVVQCRVRLIRRFLGEEVAAVEAIATHIVRPLPPDGEGVVPCGYRPSIAPEGKDRAGDPAPTTVGLVVPVVERGRRAVLLADGMQRRGVAEGPQVFGADRGGAGVRGCGPAVEHVVEEELGVRPDESLGQAFWGSQEGPVPEADSEGGIGAAEGLARAADVEDRE